MHISRPKRRGRGFYLSLWSTRNAVTGRIGDTGIGEAGRTQRAGIAIGAGTPLFVGLIARHGQCEINAQTQTFGDDLGLAQVLQRRMHT